MLVLRGFEEKVGILCLVLVTAGGRLFGEWVVVDGGGTPRSLLPMPEAGRWRPGSRDDPEMIKWKVRRSESSIKCGRYKRENQATVSTLAVTFPPLPRL